jgi:hypothetical protein
MDKIIDTLLHTTGARRSGLEFLIVLLLLLPFVLLGIFQRPVYNEITSTQVSYPHSQHPWST